MSDERKPSRIHTIDDISIEVYPFHLMLGNYEESEKLLMEDIPTLIAILQTEYNVWKKGTKQ